MARLNFPFTGAVKAYSLLYNNLLTIDYDAVEHFDEKLPSILY